METLSKQMPLGVKILSVLNYIGAGLFVIFALAIFIGAGFLTTLLGPLAGFMAFGGIVALLLAVLSFFIARGLWKGQNWARIISMILAILSTLSAILGIFSGELGNIVGLVIYGLITYYLILNKEVKQAFA